MDCEIALQLKKTDCEPSSDFDVVVIGGGPAGLAAAISAKKDGANVCLIEREARLGGILKQCIHDGFGIVRFNEKLSGPEYAQRFIEEFNKLEIKAYLQTFVTRIEKVERTEKVDRTEISEQTEKVERIKTVERAEKFDKSGEGEQTAGGNVFRLVIVNSSGISYIETKAIVMATGCRERTAKQVAIHGTRPAGVFTAGNAQHFMNLLGQKVAKKAVILGSGDIGLIMARRLTLEGSEVIGVYEAKSVPSGLTRNVQQCLRDFDIPLYLSTTVTRVFGAERVEAVEISKVDENMKPIHGTEEIIECDTLIVSVGLIPENELAESLGVELGKNNGPICDSNYETNVRGVFACGNCLHVYDLVDYVSESGEKAGIAASRYAKGCLCEAGELREDKLSEKKTELPEGKIICIVCPKGCEIEIEKKSEDAAYDINLLEKKEGESEKSFENAGIANEHTYITKGNSCRRGHDFAVQELTKPMRTLCSTVSTSFSEMPVLPVRLSGEIPKDRIFDVMKVINEVLVTEHTLVGDIVLSDILGLGVNLIATAEL